MSVIRLTIKNKLKTDKQKTYMHVSTIVKEIFLRGKKERRHTQTIIIIGFYWCKIKHSIYTFP